MSVPKSAKIGSDLVLSVWRRVAFCYVTDWKIAVSERSDRGSLRGSPLNELEPKDLCFGTRRGKKQRAGNLAARRLLDVY